MDYEKVGERIPLIGVGAIQTADDALKALQSGIPLLALGKELLIEPEWIKKIERDEEQNIALRISPEDQNRLVIPDPMWKNYGNLGYKKAVPKWMSSISELLFSLFFSETFNKCCKCTYHCTCRSSWP